jgi:hypothetical protein
MARPRPTKYRAVATTYNGVRYASRAEARRAAELDSLVKVGLIRYWVGQPTLRLGCPENVYRPDFHVVDIDGRTWFEDIKGMETSKFKRDKKLWAAYGPADLRVIRGKMVEVVPGGAGEADQ